MSSTNIFGFPRQKVPAKSKDYEFHVQCAEALIKEAAFNSQDKSFIKSLFDAANNEIDEKTYRYVTNPYNSELFNKINFPARVRNYPILSPTINLLMGEKAKRPKNYQVVATNSDSVSEAQKEIFQTALQLYQRHFINELNKIEDSGIPNQDVQQPQEVLEELNANPADKRSIIGQEALDYIIYSNEIVHQFQKSFYDYVVGGSAHTFKDVVNGEIIYEDVSPMDIDVRKGPEVEFSEDADAIVRRKLMTTAQVIDRFYNDLTPDQIDALENPSQHREGGWFTPFATTLDNKKYLSQKLIEVLHCVWRSYKKIGILTYFDEVTGSLAQIEVDEDYQADKGEDIHWIWVTEIRQVYRVDNKFYLDWGTTRVQRNKMDDLSHCKLPYNGIYFSDRFSKNKSLVEIGLPYQILYNIFHYRFELTMAKNKDKMVLLPIDAIPSQDGWDIDKFMYFADAMGFVFVDPTKEGSKGFSNYQILDASLGQYAKIMIDLMATIRMEWEEAVGITRQRKGETSASETATANQESVFRSSVITEEMFRKFEKFEEKELQGLLDCSKIAWVNGKKDMYINSDMRTSMLNIDPIEYTNTELAVFVRNSGKETEKFNLIKSYAQAAVQNGLPASSLAEILEATSFSKVKDILRKGEEAQAKIEQQVEQQRLAQEQQIAQLEFAAKQAEIEEGDKQRAHETIENARDRQNKLEIEFIRAAHGKEADNDIDDNGVPDAFEMMKMRNEQIALALEDKHKTRELDLKQKEISIKDKEASQKVEIEKMKTEQEKIKIKKAQIDVKKAAISAQKSKTKKK